MTPEPTELPASPPASVLAEVYAAHRRMEELAREGVDVDFGHDPHGRLAIKLRDGADARPLRPSDVFSLLD